MRRLARIARFGARVPEVPTYAEAFQEIGPAAIKLGQALATRPDLVGEEAARDLALLQDSLPPAPFDADQGRRSSRASASRSSEVFTEVDPEPVGAASIAQVHRAVTTEGRLVAVKVLRPNIEEDFAAAIETYEWAAAQVEAMGGEAARLRPRLVVATFRQWTNRELDLRPGSRFRLGAAREPLVAESGFFVPEIDWTPHLAGG